MSLTTTIPWLNILLLHQVFVEVVQRSNIPGLKSRLFWIS